MKPQNPTWRNHYVPRACLAHFCDTKGRLMETHLGLDGELHEDQKVPKSAGYEKDLYTLKDPGFPFRNDRPDQIERDVFGPIDDRGAKAIQKVLDGSLSDLSDTETKALAQLINSLLERHPQRIRERDVTAIEMARRSLQESRSRFGDVLEHVDVVAMTWNLHREHLVRQVKDEKAVAYLAGFKFMEVCVNENPMLKFVTGDNPVVVNLGQSWPVDYFTLALNPQTLLIGHSFSVELDTDFFRDLAIVHNFQLMRQCEYIFSRDSLQDVAFINTRKAALQFLKPVDWPTRNSKER